MADSEAEEMCIFSEERIIAQEALNKNGLDDLLI
jgi:hypothetical protein